MSDDSDKVEFQEAYNAGITIKTEKPMGECDGGCGRKLVDGSKGHLIPEGHEEAIVVVYDEDSNVTHKLCNECFGNALVWAARAARGEIKVGG